EVKALAEARLPADEVLFRHKVAVDRQRERVHPAIAGRGIGRPGDRSALRLHVHEVVAVVRVLRDDEEREAAVTERGVGVRAGKQGEDVRAAGKGRPGLWALEEPAYAALVLALRRSTADRRHV